MQSTHITKYSTPVPVSEVQVGDFIVSYSRTMYVSSISKEARRGLAVFKMKRLGSSTKCIADATYYATASNPDRVSFYFCSSVTKVRYPKDKMKLINASYRSLVQRLGKLRFGKNRTSAPIKDAIEVISYCPPGLVSGITLHAMCPELGLPGMVRGLVYDTLEYQYLPLGAEFNPAFSRLVSASIITNLALGGESVDQIKTRYEKHYAADLEINRLSELKLDLWKLNELK